MTLLLYKLLDRQLLASDINTISHKQPDFLHQPMLIILKATLINHPIVEKDLDLEKEGKK